MITKDNITKMVRGAVVQHVDTEMIGHINGFSLNCFKEIIVEVDWADKRVFTVHPAHLTFEVNYEAYLERWMTK